MSVITCKRCGHTWTPKVDTPLYCPHCKQPQYNKPSWKEKLGEKKEDNNKNYEQPIKEEADKPKRKSVQFD